MKWMFKEKPLDNSISQLFFGFVYKISFGDLYYIGSKQFATDRKMTAKQLKERTDQRLTRCRTESDWETYNSSSKLVQKLIADVGEGNFKFEILKLCKSKQELGYNEIKLQFQYDVLFDPKSMNDNIGQNLYKGSIGIFPKKDFK